MTFKCIHISDIHFRGLKRHDEYREVFKSFFKKAKDLNPDVIYIGGDIVHSKTQGISPELIDILNWWFTSMAEISKVYVILGNHDGLLLNKDRQDAISPILKALNNENIILYKKSGTYPCENSNPKVNWCVFSCFDEEGWKNVKPVDGEINIALYHGAVLGSLTDSDWELEGEVSLSFFENYDFGFLGDIHKRQYLDNEKRIVYPGSPIQQNYGECISKGFLYWEIKSKNDFTSKYISLDNPHPFVTILWEENVDKTFEKVKLIDNGSRFRIHAKDKISQGELESLYRLIKEVKNPKEIVFKIENKNALKEIDFQNESKLCNITNELKRVEYLKEYFTNETEENISKINDLFKNEFDKVTIDNKVASNNWSIESLEFSNTFSYGKSNKIDFNKLKGVVGIFGKNRSGKSSIPGTIMYCLYNSTDRGAMKNIHIINNRKNFCEAKMNILVNGDQYSIARSTKKHNTKKGSVWSSTNLTLNSIDAENTTDQSEEQRRETEKTLRSLIGTSDNFLYTSFSSQGEINKFITEKSSVRKTILSNFLGLDIFEEMYKSSRDQYAYYKTRVKNLVHKNWEDEISQHQKEVDECNLVISKSSNEIKNLQDNLLNLKVTLSNINKDLKRHKSGYNLSEVKNMIKRTSNEKNKLQNNLETLYLKKDKLEEKINKFKLFKESFSLEDLNREKERLSILLDKKQKIENQIKIILKDKNTSDKKLKILSDIPCDDMFPNCKFIKDAYIEKNKENNYEAQITSLKGSVLEIKNIIDSIKREEIEEKISKYNTIINSEYKTNFDYNSCVKEIEQATAALKQKETDFEKYEEIKLEIENLEDEDLILKEKKLNNEINLINLEIKSLDQLLRTKNSDYYYHENKVKEILKEKKEYESLIDDWKIYEMFSNCISKKGIPSDLIKNLLPKINYEINSILAGITSFKIEIESDGNKNIEVYIDYGEGKRVIECGSGMEKMISSIAIRVALINITNLPKSNIFIIDEGFGALDESNIEACSRLLQKLKSYFKTILIISHVDAIKDIVDISLKIDSKGKDLNVRY